MPVSVGVLDAHISRWETHYGKTSRGTWPSRLFRHEALENAALILRQGSLLSRNDAAGLLARDVAPDSIINLDNRAHSFTRLYFRPKTPTQYHIEGIRKPGECQFPGKHAPLLYMFAFKSRSVLARDGVQFSNGNMQVGTTSILSGDVDFQNLPFDKIYHEGPYSTSDPAQADIKVWRCAEVLCPSPLVLDEALEAVVCRSHAERKTLLYKLGDQAVRWRHRIQIVSHSGFFNAEYAFVESVDLKSDGIHVRFHPRRRLPMEAEVKLIAKNDDDRTVEYNFPLQSLDLRKQWRFPCKPVAGNYKIKVRVDGEEAYVGISTFDPDPF